MKTEYSLEKSISEARQFIEDAELAVENLKCFGRGGKLVATAKRRSMDLSNALIELRKSSYYQ